MSLREAHGGAVCNVGHGNNPHDLREVQKGRSLEDHVQAREAPEAAAAAAAAVGFFFFAASTHREEKTVAASTHREEKTVGRGFTARAAK